MGLKKTKQDINWLLLGSHPLRPMKASAGLPDSFSCSWRFWLFHALSTFFRFKNRRFRFSTNSRFRFSTWPLVVGDKLLTNSTIVHHPDGKGEDGHLVEPYLGAQQRRRSCRRWRGGWSGWPPWIAGGHRRTSIARRS
jgi:hypothetical protein